MELNLTMPAPDVSGRARSLPQISTTIPCSSTSSPSPPSLIAVFTWGEEAFEGGWEEGAEDGGLNGRGRHGGGNCVFISGQSAEADVYTRGNEEWYTIRAGPWFEDVFQVAIMWRTGNTH